MQNIKALQTFPIKIFVIISEQFPKIIKKISSALDLNICIFIQPDNPLEILHLPFYFSNY